MVVRAGDLAVAGMVDAVLEATVVMTVVAAFCCTLAVRVWCTAAWAALAVSAAWQQQQTPAHLVA